MTNITHQTNLDIIRPLLTIDPALFEVITDKTVLAETVQNLSQAVLKILNIARTQCPLKEGLPLMLYFYCGTTADRINNHFNPYSTKINPLEISTDPSATLTHYYQLRIANSTFLKQVAIDLNKKLKSEFPKEDGEKVWTYDIIKGASNLQHMNESDHASYIRVTLYNHPPTAKEFVPAVYENGQEVPYFPSDTYINDLTKTLVFGYTEDFQFPSYKDPANPFGNL